MDTICPGRPLRINPEAERPSVNVRFTEHSNTPSKIEKIPAELIDGD
jgi:hypothetical protein